MNKHILNNILYFTYNHCRHICKTVFYIIDYYFCSIIMLIYSIIIITIMIYHIVTQNKQIKDIDTINNKLSNTTVTINELEHPK